MSMTEEKFEKDTKMTPNEKRWVLSDMHFFHTKVIEYENRPFPNVRKMNNKIINNWNKTVAPNDVVYVLGDVAMGYHGKEELKKVIKGLHGKKFLIQGNHDKHNPQYYLDIGFAYVYKNSILYDKDVIMSHRPPELISKDYIYLYGHTHAIYHPAEDEPNCFNVSVERINYTPIDLDELVEALRTNKKEEFKKKYNIMPRGFDKGKDYEKISDIE